MHKLVIYQTKQDPKTYEIITIPYNSYKKIKVSTKN